jgi:Zn-dependent M28 family amino/carboxypeptidase
MTLLFARAPLALVLSAALAFGATGAAPSTERYMDHVRYLASEEMKGRGNGLPELEKAARYIAGEYKKLGLKPAFGGSYFQPFTVTTSARIGPKNKLAANGRKLKQGDDFQPFNFSASEKLSAQVVFAGYGITAPEYKYDDYAGLDVKGKIVLILRFEPQDQDEKSVFAGKNRTRHATFESKASNAKMHGAKAVIFADQSERDKFQPFGRTAGPSESGIPFVQVKTAVAEKWLEASGKNLDGLVKEIDSDLKPRSFELPGSFEADLQTDVVRDRKTVNNVGVYLPGESDEYVVIGAHYDHIGLGQQFSMAPSMSGKPHLGADDNASGTAGALELARWAAGQPKLKRGLLILNFAGEEIGLLGSSYWVEHPSLPLEKCVAMLNMDMIGRMKENSAVVGGVGSGSTFKAMMDRAAAKYQSLKLEYSEQPGVGGSDHMSFAAKRVPNLFFFTGLHMDYHRPTDTADKINADGAVALLSVVADLATELASAPERPAFVKQAEPAAPSASSGGGEGRSGGYGPSFGSVPDMAFQGKGVRFSDFREGSPAAKAGLKAGDVMIEFDGKKVDNLYDFTYALRGKQVGETVVVKVIRDGQPVDISVKLEARR